MVQLIKADKFNLDEQKAAAKKDGKVRELIVDSDGTLTPMTIAPQVQLLVGELRELCAKASSDLSVAKAKSVAGLPDRMVVVILQQDYDALAGKVAKAKTTPSKQAE